MLTSRVARLVQPGRIRSFQSSSSNEYKGYVLRAGPAITSANSHVMIVSTDSYTDSSIAKIECLIINACTKKTMGKGSGGRWVELLRMSHPDFGAYKRTISVAPKCLYPLSILCSCVFQCCPRSLGLLPHGDGKSFAQPEWALPSY